jgi:peptidoglycan/LPS O-acetylase OafA/YrhL
MQERRDTGKPVLADFLSLRRPTPAQSFIAEVDGLRLVAILLVVLHHNHVVLRGVIPPVASDDVLWAAYRSVAQAGGIGVPLFFVISGMVLALPFSRARLAGGTPVSLRSYFWRRLRRLEPPYIINLTILFSLAVVAGGSAVFFERFDNYVLSLLYLHNIVLDAWSEINFVAWSLEVEAQFYLLAPFLAVIFFRGHPLQRAVLVLAAVLILSVFRMIYLDGSFRYTHSILGYGQYFLVGLLFADLMVSGRLYARRPNPVADALAIVFFVVAIAFDLGRPLPELHAFGAIPLGLSVFFVFRGRWLLRLLRLPVVYIAGGMCYTIYLYHFWIIRAPVDAFGLDQLSYTPLGVVAFDLTMIILVLAVSAVLFVLFERPFMNRARSTGSSGRSPDGHVAP